MENAVQRLQSANAGIIKRGKLFSQSRNAPMIQRTKSDETALRERKMPQRAREAETK
jgi:hypothetical protein